MKIAKSERAKVETASEVLKDGNLSGASIKLFEHRLELFNADEILASLRL